MPSGAKKRKAAKKKKDQQAHNNSNSSSINDSHRQGNDDPKSQDERESDGGEVDSPASQDHQNQHHSFNEENEESEKRVQPSFVTEDKPVDGVTGDAEGSQNTGVEDERLVKIEREVNLEQDIESVDVNVEHVESLKELHDGDNKSSISSSSDDESQALDKNWKAESHNSASDAISYNIVEKLFPEEVTEESRTEKPLIKANGNSVMETAPAFDLATSVVPMSEVGKHVLEGARFENSEVLDVVEPGLKENDDKLLPKSDGVVVDLVPDENKEKYYLILDENVGASTIVGTSSLNGHEDKMLYSSSAQTSYAENVKDSKILDGMVTKNEGKILALSGAHTSEASTDVDKAKDFMASEHIETQPLVPPPQIAQRSSWMSCCGLFDVFTGSDR